MRQRDATPQRSDNENGISGSLVPRSSSRDFVNRGGDDDPTSVDISSSAMPVNGVKLELGRESTSTTRARSATPSVEEYEEMIKMLVRVAERDEQRKKKKRLNESRRDAEQDVAQQQQSKALFTEQKRTYRRTVRLHS